MEKFFVTDCCSSYGVKNGWNFLIHLKKPVLILPDVKKRAMELLLGLLKKGEISGFENDFEDFMDLALDFLGDLPGGFSNFETGGKSFEVKAAAMKIRRNKFKTLKTATCEYCLSTFSSKHFQANNLRIDTLRSIMKPNKVTHVLFAILHSSQKKEC